MRASGRDPGHQAATRPARVDRCGDEVAEQAGALASRYIRSHPGVEVVDYVIAASAQRLEAELSTTNVRHFPMFEDLASPYGA